MKNFKKLTMYDENIKTAASNSTNPLLGLDNVSKRSSFENAMYWYLKGFEDAETTESQPVSHEQTMKDAETHFYLVWDCYVNAR